MCPHQDTLRACVSAMRASLAEAPPRRVEDAALYLAHVEGAAPLRRLAQASGKAPASIHRAIRRMEALRDDPLIDRALEALGAVARGAMDGGLTGCGRALSVAKGSEPAGKRSGGGGPPATLSDYARRVAMRALERLSEPDAFLMIAEGANKAGIFCKKNQFRRPLALLTLEAAADLAARDWVRSVSRKAHSTKYVVTDTGRAWLRGVLAREPGAAREARAPSLPLAPASPTPAEPASPERVRALRAALAESPLAWLATRKGPDGAPFLAPAEVEAAERLVSDYDAAQPGPDVRQDWRGLVVLAQGRKADGARAEARGRLAGALEALGSGLADVALRTCCLREGLEVTERRMGWSARSGKVVLKIALQRLADHYGTASRRPAGA